LRTEKTVKMKAALTYRIRNMLIPQSGYNRLILITLYASIYIICIIYYVFIYK